MAGFLLLMNLSSSEFRNLAIAMIRAQRAVERVHFRCEGETPAQLSSALDRHCNWIEHIADLVGVPQDNTNGCTSQAEFERGTCSHGIEIYCRDWLLEAIYESEKTLSSERLYNELVKEGKKYNGLSIHCLKCEAGDHPEFQEEIAMMAASN